MLEGRLGLETARVPHADRHGCIWLRRGHLFVEAGTLKFTSVDTTGMGEGSFAIPFQMLSAIILEPGTAVTHDAFRLMARHGTTLVFSGEDGVRLYASLPFGKDQSSLARAQVAAWADPAKRIAIARRMYAWRLGEILPSEDIAVLRGIEGARVRSLYSSLARQFGIEWNARRYDRTAPEAADLVNQSINHCATALRAAALCAVAATSTVPQLGFVHEDSASAFALDIADMFRESACLPAAFRAVQEFQRRPNLDIERVARRSAGRVLRDEGVIPAMIDRIKDLFQPQPSPPSPPSPP